MKNILLGILLGFALTGLIAFKVANYEAKTNTSEVEQIQGYYIFYKSKPVQEYERIGNFKLTIAPEQPEKCLEKLVEKCLKKYPNGNGLIIQSDLYGCDVIKFK